MKWSGSILTTREPTWGWSSKGLLGQDFAKLYNNYASKTKLPATVTCLQQWKIAMRREMACNCVEQMNNERNRCPPTSVIQLTRLQRQNNNVLTIINTLISL